MIQLHLRRLSASIPAMNALTAIGVVFLLSFTVAAQTVPSGYVASREGDVIVMRPSAAGDPEVDIRVYPAVSDNHDAVTVAHRWAASHPPAGVNPSALSLQDKTVNGVSTLFRSWVDGGKARVELIMMPLASPGRYQPVIARMPSQPGPLVTSHSQAMARVVALILAGQFLSDKPDGKAPGPSADLAPVEPRSNRAVPERSAPVRAVGAETQATAEQLARSMAGIEAVGFMTRTEMGVGGMFTYVPKPVVLFRGGDALLDMGNLNRVTSVDADRFAHPRDWGRWRQTANGIEILEGDKWKKLTYAKTMQRLSTGFVLSGDFERTTGGGDAATGGKTTIMGHARYSFRPDGKFSRTQLGTVDTTAVDYHTFVSSGNRSQEGRYHIEGYVLTLEPAGGQPETHLIATYPTDPSIIWIDGRGYARPAH